jgi:tetratricopeptide (TPR) repeat protein
MGPHKTKKSSGWLVDLTLVLIAGVVLILSACAPAPKQESDLTRAYRLIDAQRSDEAIALLEKINDEEPENDQYRIALASAYANKAGVKVQKIWSLVKISKNAKQLTEALGAAEPGEKEPSEKVDDALDQVADTLARFALIMKIYVAIPNVELANRPYLAHAVTLLASIENIPQGDAMFRALLRIIEFKSDLAVQLIGVPKKTQRANQAEGCAVDFERMGSAIAVQSAQLGAILEDLSIALPDQAEQLNGVRTKIAQTAADLTKNMTSLIVMEKSASVALKQSIIDNNFGKLLRCGGSRP